jgi:hypothetical protein
MFQFNRYGRPKNTYVPEDVLFLAIRQYIENSDVGRFYCTLMSLLEKYCDVSVCLMALRVSSWLRNGEFSGQPGKDALYTIVEESINEKIDCFQQQELLGLLGRDWFRARDLTSKVDLAIDLQGDYKRGGGFCEFTGGPLFYALPSFSGLFSTIESIFLLWFFATEIRGGTLVLAPERYWWRYEIPFRDIFGSFFSIIMEEDVANVSWVPRSELFQWFQSSEPDVKKKFHNFKCANYPIIISIFNNYFLQSGEKQLTPVDAIVFIRGGDKIDQETVPFPEQLVLEELQHLQSHGRVGLLSDDWTLANQYSSKLPYVVNLTQTDSSGHYLGRCRTKADVIKIIQNMLALCLTPVAVGCPSSNLINAANYYRRGTGRDVYKSDLFPVPTYLLL